MNKAPQPKVWAERIPHREAVARLRQVYRWLVEFEAKAVPRLGDENDVNDSEKEQEVNK